MPKWSKIEAGENVLLKGESYVVEAITKKPKKGKAIVTINGRRGRFAGREVKLDDKVERGSDDPKGGKPEKVKGDPLHDAEGRQRRWAHPGELEAVIAPHKPKGGPWDKPKGAAEKAVAKILGATLVGETDDEHVGWYVPPVDPSTIAAHLMLFHDIALDGETYAEMVKLHDDAHARHEREPFGAPLHVNHWHKEKRP